MLRVSARVLLMLWAVSASLAQQPPCTVLANVVTEQLPYALIVFPSIPPTKGYGFPPELWLPARGLSPESFIVRDGRHRVPVLSVETYTGPRRIVLVVVFDRGLATAEHGGLIDRPRIALGGILSKARAEDSFALLTAWPHIAVPFGSSPTALRASIHDLSPSTAQFGRKDDVLDTILEAASWFGSPEKGDSILVIGGFGGPRAKTSQVRHTLAGRGIRLFDLGAGMSDGSCTDWLLCGYSLSPDGTLAEDTGGGWEPVGYLGPKAADENVWLWQTEAKTLYDMATFAYVLRLAKTGPHVKIELSGEALSRLHRPRLSYPRPLPVCP